MKLKEIYKKAATKANTDGIDAGNEDALVNWIRQNCKYDYKNEFYLVLGIGAGLADIQAQENGFDNEVHRALEASMTKRRLPVRLNKEQITSKEGFKRVLKDNQFVILTAENPQGKPASGKENKRLNKQLIGRLKDYGFTGVYGGNHKLLIHWRGFVPITGVYGGNQENSFLIFNASIKEGLDLAKEFNQESIISNIGLVYQDSTFNPGDLDSIVFDNSLTDMFSQVNINGQTQKFIIPIDFEKKEEYYED